MLANLTGKMQAFYYHGETIEIPDRFAFEEHLNPGGVGFEKLSSEEFRLSMLRADRLMLQRTFGLGDVLMLAPVVDELKKEMGDMDRKVFLATTRPEFRGDILRGLSKGTFTGYVQGSDAWRHGYDFGVYLDYYLERDHTDDKFKEWHRVDLYRKFFELGTGTKPMWGRPIVWDREPYIAVQEAGTRELKGFPKETYQYVLDDLSQFYKVVPLPRDSVISPWTYAERIGRASCLVTFDSAPLWISHYTETPTVCILGPSRAEQRLVYHPLWPDRVVEVNLAKEIGCAPCFELMNDCSRRVDCMNVSPDRLLELLHPAIEKVMR